MSSRYDKLINKGKNLPHDTGKNVFRNIDNTLVEQGCKMFQSNVFSMFVCMLSGLFTLMYIPSIVKVLEVSMYRRNFFWSRKNKVKFLQLQNRSKNTIFSLSAFTRFLDPHPTKPLLTLYPYLLTPILLCGHFLIVNQA